MSFLLTARTSSADEPLTLPPAPTAQPPTSLPLVAAVVPVIGAVGMWMMTGSALMLWFAALGPLMLVAGLADRARGRRREGRRERVSFLAAMESAADTVAQRQGRARRDRWAVHPSVADLVAAPAEVWRSHPQREGTVTLGSGMVQVETSIGRGDERPEVQELRARAQTLADSPVVVALDGDICVRGNPIVAAAVARAIVLHVCLLHPPGRWQVLARGEPWQEDLPHTLGAPGARTLALVGPTDPRPPADVTVSWTDRRGSVPAGAPTVIELDDALTAVVGRGAVTAALRCEAVSTAQAVNTALILGARAQSESSSDDPFVPFAQLGEAEGVLAVSIGRAGGQDAVLDIVTDGPHAVVVGTTGAGKSEFLITWVAALCRSYPPDAVQLMLADFKGGTAFEPLAALPHVVGVLTDLDGELAERAVRSLAAEIRRREAVIASAGARDIGDSRVTLPRLIIVVDEFPALITQHPEVEPVFTDIAARGRALGMHLVIGAQRVAGVVRDATLANCPLRIALRVSSEQDSRAVIGDDDAARLSGGPDGRGMAYVRRSGDAVPIRTRIALTSTADLARVAGIHHDIPSLARPWLPPLPDRIGLSEVNRHISETEGDQDGADPHLVIAVADDPDHQRRRVVRLAIGERGLVLLGRAKSGKTTFVDMLDARVSQTLRVASDPEAAWDALVRWEAESPALVLIDDLDVLLTLWPEPWAGEAAARIESLVRRSGMAGTTVIVTAQRASGPSARIIDLIPRRAVLAQANRADHLLAGGESSAFRADRPPGRATLDGLEVQLLCPDEARDGAGTEESAMPPLRSSRAEAAGRETGVPRWRPAGPGALTGVVLRGSAQRHRHLERIWAASLLSVSDVPATELDPPRDVVLVGDPEQWQRAWRLLEAVRREGELVISAECSSDVRTLTGDRSLPPFALPGRAWLCRMGAALTRVTWE
ncbi:FtsK/SpoIIIE domain-containing protein [Microbacterium sp. ZW T5_56]|uniref:FtsK/SpoIIIE domain-containing protein n=1 Tax=Microbacterium sp. ZW T5_56 TaxID=3378081 RepID=UPI003853B1BB